MLNAYRGRDNQFKLTPYLTGAVKADLDTWLLMSGESLNMLVANWLTAYVNKHKAEIEEYRAFVSKYRKETDQ